MIDRDAAARAQILAKLAQSREEIRRVLEPPRDPPGNHADSRGAHPAGSFPRSRTLQLLMSGRGLGAVGAAAAGLLVARPALALRILRLLPASAIGKMLLARAVGAVQSRRR